MRRNRSAKSRMSCSFPSDAAIERRPLLGSVGEHLHVLDHPSGVVGTVEVATNQGDPLALPQEPY